MVGGTYFIFGYFRVTAHWVSGSGDCRNTRLYDRETGLPIMIQTLLRYFVAYVVLLGGFCICIKDAACKEQQSSGLNPKFPDQDSPREKGEPERQIVWPALRGKSDVSYRRAGILNM